MSKLNIVTEYINDKLTNLRWRRNEFWRSKALFTENKDAHGVWDCSVDVYALERAIKEIEEIKQFMEENFDGF